MGFEYQKEPGKSYSKITYNDDLINSIFKRKSDLEIDIQTEIEKLESLKADIEKEYDAAIKKRDSISDWDSNEYESAEEEAWDLQQKIYALDDIIDSLNSLFGD